MPAPLLNDYKTSFVLRRFVRTLSGGPQIPPAGTPFRNALTLVILQSIVYFAPWVGGGIVYAVWGNKGCRFGSGPNIGYGAIMMLLIFTLHIPSYASFRRRRERIANSDMLNSDDEELPLEGPLLSSAYNYAFREQKQRTDRIWLIHRVVQTVLSGFFLSACVAYLAPGVLQARFGSNRVAWVMYALGWITVLMAQWSLTSSPPPEPNTYYTEDRWRLDIYTRPMYLFLILIIGGVQIWVPSLHVVNFYLCILWVTFPLLWTTGVAPALRIFIEAALERAHVALTAAPATLSPARTAWIFLLITVPAITITCVLLVFVSRVAALSFATIAGCIAASRVCIDWITTKSRHTLDDTPHLLPRIHYNVESIYLLLRCFLLAGEIAAIVSTSDILTRSTTSAHPGTIILLILVVVFTILLIASHEFQQVYLPTLLPILRNPLLTFNEEDDDLRSNMLKSFGILHRLAYQILPYVVSGWILARALEDFAPNLDSPLTSAWFWLSLVLFRAFRYTWLRPGTAGIVVCIVAIVDATGGWWWNEKDVGTRLLIAAILWEVAVRAWWKCGFWITTLSGFLFKRKQRRRRWYFYTIASVLLTPPVIVISSVLDAPMVPFLGLPVFWIGYPRSMRFWPTVDNDYAPTSDSLLYSTLLPTLLPRLARKIASGALPSFSSSNNILLARLGSRLLLLRCVEVYFEGIACVVIGVELEPTSCHALEGAEVDKVLERVLITDQGGWINKDIWRTLKPTGIVKTDAYTDTRSVVTGVLDHPTALRQIHAYFLKTLVWLFMRRMNLEDVKRYAAAPPALNRDTLQSCMERFPTKWYEFLRSLEVHATGTVGKKSTDTQGRAHKRRVINSADEVEDAVGFLTGVCTMIVFGINSPTPSSNPLSDLRALFRLYRGDLPTLPSTGRTWLEHPDRADLRQICLLAARYAIRIVYERSVAGQDLDSPGFDEVDKLLKSYVTTQHTSLDPTPSLSNPHPFDTASTPAAWREELSHGVDTFFGLYLQSEGLHNQTVGVRMVKRERGIRCLVGEINGEGVRGIWANLVLELLYMTNDDDERYSIQAHELLLRNLTVQTANPPLGYPLYLAQASLTHPLPGAKYIQKRLPGARKKYGRVYGERQLKPALGKVGDRGESRTGTRSAHILIESEL